MFSSMIRGPVSFPVASPGMRQFSPLDISGLKMWLKADAGLFKDAAKAQPATSDGDAIYTWADQSGLGNDVIQATLANRPLLKLGIQNGLPIVRLDATNDVMGKTGFTDTWLDNKAFTIFFVCLSGDGAFGLCGNSIVGNAGIPRLYLQLFAFSYNTNRTIVGTSVAKIINTYQHSLAPSQSFWQNGTLAGTATQATTAFGGDGAFALGLKAGDISHAGDIAEILIYDSALSTASRQSVESYLNSRWAIY